jgi:hypothetical protein
MSGGEGNTRWEYQYEASLTDYLCQYHSRDITHILLELDDTIHYSVEVE